MRLVPGAAQAVKTFLNYGTGNEDLVERHSLRKRVKLVNVLAFSAAAIAFVSLPLDFYISPSWMVVEDLISVVAFTAIPFLNRRGRYSLSRFFLLLFGNCIFIFNVVRMGTDSGFQLVFFAVAGLGAMLYVAEERIGLLFGIGLPVVAYFFLIAIGPEWFPPVDVPTNQMSFYYSSAANFILISVSFFFLRSVGDSATENLHRSRESAIHSEKMAALGEMSSGVAHEINTPLWALRLNVSLIQRYLADPVGKASEIRVSLGNLERMADRITKITRALQNFSRSAESDPTLPTPIAGIIQEASDLCRERFKNAGVTLVIDPVPLELIVECRPSQICQVLLNLLNNAFFAVTDTPEKRIHVRVYSNGTQVRIQVSDTGGGVLPEIREKIFQPFFTTKAPGAGTGLGLSVSKGIIEEHHGKIHLANLKHPTEFMVELPRAEGRS